MRFVDIVFVYHLRDEGQIAWHGRRHSHARGSTSCTISSRGSGRFRNGPGTSTIVAGKSPHHPAGRRASDSRHDIRKPMTYYAVLFNAAGDEEPSAC